MTTALLMVSYFHCFFTPTDPIHLGLIHILHSRPDEHFQQFHSLKYTLTCPNSPNQPVCLLPPALSPAPLTPSAFTREGSPFPKNRVSLFLHSCLWLMTSSQLRIFDKMYQCHLHLSTIRLNGIS